MVTNALYLHLTNKVYDSARFMMRSFSNLSDNLAEGIHKIKCKDCHSFLEYVSKTI